MPILVPRGLPAYSTLKHENVFVMQSKKALKQDIRPLSIGIINLMPLKEVTETQLIRLLANTPLQVELKLLTLATHEFSHVDPLHMETFYQKFDEAKNQKLDGLIITGAPVERMRYEDVDYWDEMKSIMDYSQKNVFSTIHLCWAAQAALYYHYGIEKQIMDKKLFGVFKHKVKDKKHDLTRGFDDEFYVPHSRFSRICKEDVEATPDLRVLVESKEAGIHMLESKNKRNIFLQGHWEYDWNTLKNEYERDAAKGKDIQIPANYFTDDNPKKHVKMTWAAHANIFVSNWLNYVYQKTPYNLDELDNMYLG